SIGDLHCRRGAQPRAGKGAEVVTSSHSVKSSPMSLSRISKHLSRSGRAFTRLAVVALSLVIPVAVYGHGHGGGGGGGHGGGGHMGGGHMGGGSFHGGGYSHGGGGFYHGGGY